MSKPKPPPAPDYAALAKQQGAESRDTAEYNARLNRVNQIDPQGASLTWTTTPGPDGQPIWTQTTSYSPEQQQLYDSGMRVQQNLAGVAEGGLNRVGQAMATPFDQSRLPGMTGGIDRAQFAKSFDSSGVRALPGQVNDESRRRVEQAVLARMNPELDRQETALRTRMLNSGIEVGSEAYNREMQNFGQQRNDALTQAVLAGGAEESRQVGLNQGLQGQEFSQAMAGQQFGQQGQQMQHSADIAGGAFGNQARQQALQEQAYLRQLPLNELNALRSGAQVQGPQFSNYYTGSSAQASPLFDAGMAQGNYDMQAYQQRQAGYNALLGGLAGMGSAYLMPGMKK